MLGPAGPPQGQRARGRWHGDLATEQSGKVHVCKEGVLLHLCRARGTEPPRGLALHRRADQGPAIPRDVVGHLQGEVLDVCEERLAVRVVERRQPCQHVEEKHAQVVDVDSVPVPTLEENLGREEGNGADKGLGAPDAGDSLLREAKVGEQRMVPVVHHDVVWLEVPEDGLPLVQMAKSQENLRRVEPRERLLQPLLAAN
mmetsp:Transcript_44607/g.133158  ORF Transcript_44607/g.133158 Transcript_44607/m.133158 type:complete len:200 (-) Transcript_44607:1417-2016(-)